MSIVILQKACKNEIKQAVKDTQGIFSKTKALVNANNEGNMKFTEFGDHDKKYIQDLWLNLLSLSDEMDCLEVSVEDIDFYSLMSGKVLYSDIENIEECRKTENIFVCDDLFIRKAFYSIKKQDTSTNFVGLLLSNGQLTHEELMNLTLQLSQDRYILCVNSRILLRLYSCIRD